MSQHPRDKVKKVINGVSKSFCLAKWLQVTIDLAHGTNHSCHHPKRHKIPLDELEKDVSALHNTTFKKEKRKEMLQGIRPPECSYCWKVEDLSSENISDRIIKSADDWAYPHLEKVLNLDWDENINPTYVEVMFDKSCNLSCAYCIADVSSSIAGEMKKHGPYPVMDQTHRVLREENYYPEEDQNPYLEAFWKWLPKMVKDLETLRITGGEPFLQTSTMRLLDFIADNPQPHLVLAINSNLGIPQVRLDMAINKIKKLVSEKKIKRFELYTSLDTVGKQAAYIRAGLDESYFWESLIKFSNEVKPDALVIMCTFNALSIPNFKNLLEKVLNLKKSIPGLILDIAYLRDPHYLRANMVTDDLMEMAKDAFYFMKDNSHSNDSSFFSPHEVGKFENIIGWMSEPVEHGFLIRDRRDFCAFVDEYDKRKGTNFLEIFPEMKRFYTVCKKAFIITQ